jgi:tRNA A-37 threonylcarbamoyl transferase component Bud32
VGTAVEPGSTVAGFRIVSLIGDGAMGTVFRAEDAGGTVVALKLLAPQLARDERFRQRFLRESRIAAGLRHPYVVPVVASGDADGVLYLAMEHVDGPDLREILRREGRLEPERALQLLGKVADALDAAHAAGLIHRDVKPANILVDGDRAVVCDFGLARHVASVESLTSDRGFVGTVDYVAPEQIEGKPIDGRVDVYSLGCVLYEAVTGERPFARGTDLATVYAHLSEPPPRVSEVRPELSSGLDQVFATALAKDPDERYTTAGELIREARKALHGKRRRLRVTRDRVVLATLAVAGLAATGVLAGLLATRSPHAPPPPKPLKTKLFITPRGFADAPLGLKYNDYKSIFGVGYRDDVFATPNFPVLYYFDRKLGIYFRRLGGNSIIETTWNKHYRTAAGVGPCTSITRLKHVYGNALRPSPANTSHGQAYAYVIGHMVFGANGPPGHPSPTVTAVGIYRGISLAFAGFVTLNEPSCGADQY